MIIEGDALSAVFSQQQGMLWSASQVDNERHLAHAARGEAVRTQWFHDRCEHGLSQTEALYFPATGVKCEHLEVAGGKAGAKRENEAETIGRQLRAQYLVA